MKQLCTTFLLLLALINISTGQKIEKIEFHNGKIKLAGSLFIPDAPGKHPAIAVTHGSGRDGRSQPGYISLANHLVKQGFVVLIFDKRGVGESDGKYIEVPDMNTPAGDLSEAVNYLQTRKEVDKNKIGVYGHSQGGWVAPIAAVTNGDIAFVIVSCGGGVSMREQDLYSYRAIFKQKGHSKEAIDTIINFTRQLFTYLNTGMGYTALNSLYGSSVNQPWFSFFKEMGFSDRLPPPSMLREPVFNFFKAINYDPQSTLRALNVPTLVMLAEKDETIPSEKCKQLWEDAFYASGNLSKLSVIILKDEDHYIFATENGKAIYKQTFRDVMIKWLNAKIK